MTPGAGGTDGPGGADGRKARRCGSGCCEEYFATQLALRIAARMGAAPAGGLVRRRGGGKLARWREPLWGATIATHPCSWLPFLPCAQLSSQFGSTNRGLSVGVGAGGRRERRKCAPRPPPHPHPRYTSLALGGSTAWSRPASLRSPAPQPAYPAKGPIFRPPPVVFLA